MQNTSKEVNELIFSDYDGIGVKEAPKVKTLAEGEKVDIEIILLGPKRGVLRKTKGRRGLSSAQSKIESAKSAGPSGVNRDEDDKKLRIDDELLKRMEKRYEEGANVSADENAYVDYMDYF